MGLSKTARAHLSLVKLDLGLRGSVESRARHHRVTLTISATMLGNQRVEISKISGTDFQAKTRS